MLGLTQFQPGLTGYGGLAGPSGFGFQPQSSGFIMNQMMALMSLVMMMTEMQMMMSPVAQFGGGSPLGIGGGGLPGLGNFLGSGSGSGGGGGSYGSGATGATNASFSPSGGGSSSRAVDIAKQYLGQKSGTINNMKNFTHAGGMTNNCADFVSACLANAGVYKKKPGDASVRVLKQHLIEDGWRKVSKAQAKPGDVAIFNGTQHVELVATQGASKLIGSNNGGKSYQTVGYDSGNWGSVEYYTKG